MKAILLTTLTLLCLSGVAQTSSHTLPDTEKPKRNQGQFVLPSDSVGAHIVQINRIFIIGNRLTRDHIILRELSVKAGDTLTAYDLSLVLEQDKKKIFNTRLFNTVDIKKLETEKGKVDLVVDLNERWYTFPAPIFDLADRNFNEWWQNYDHDFSRVNYGLRLYQYNVRGRNETLTATMQFGFNRVFAVRYRIPYIDRKQKQGLVIDLDFQETKNLAYQTLDHKLDFYQSNNLLLETRGAGLTYTYRNSFYETHGLQIEFRTSVVSDSITLLNPNYFGTEQQSQDLFALSYYFSSDHRDVITYPLNGYHFWIKGIKTGFGLDVNKTELLLSYAKYMDLNRNFFLSNYSYGYWSSPENQPYNQYGAMGYNKEVIRGYEIYVIEGPYYAINKTTLKKRIFSKIYRWEKGPIEQFRHIPLAIYLKTYADFGFVRNYPDYEQNSRLSDQLLMGAGAGIDFVSSYDTVLRFEYSFNNEGMGGFFFNLRKEF